MGLLRKDIWYKLSGLGGTVLVLAAWTYKELERIHVDLRTITDVFDVEKRKVVYIPINDQDNGIGENSDHSESFIATESARKWSDIKLKVQILLKKAFWLPIIKSQSQDPWVLLKLAQSSDDTVRELVIKSLSKPHPHWDEASYLAIAQACDRRTAIGLARMPGVDSRFFLTPHRLCQPVGDTDSVSASLIKLLTSLPQKGTDKCTQFFTDIVVKESSVPSEEKESLWSFDSSGVTSSQSSKTLISDNRMDFLCLQALLSHSLINTHCVEIVQQGGLSILHKLCESQKQSVKIQQMVSHVLANLTMNTNLQRDIVSAGWLKTLSEWMKSLDIQLCTLATKSLANLDAEFHGVKYPDGVYLYHPQYRNSGDQEADIVFIHGLLGGPFYTWRQKEPAEKKKADTKGTQAKYSPLLIAPTVTSNCWPKDWLPKDCPETRVIGVDYESYLSEWTPKCPYDSEKRTIAERSRELLTKLVEAGIGDRPVVWVGHSMGGLLIKRLLLDAHQDPDHKNIVEQTKGIIFYSVPHKGSPVAAYGNSAMTRYFVYPSVEVGELAQDSKKLAELHTSFQNLTHIKGIPLLSFVEGQKTNLPFKLDAVLVPPESGDPGFGDVYHMAGMDHIDVCKPRSRESPLYKLTLQFILSCLPGHPIETIKQTSLPKMSGEDDPVDNVFCE